MTPTGGSKRGLSGLRYLRLLPAGRFSGPLIIVAVTLIVWLGSFTSVLRLSDRAVYDRFLHLAQSFRDHRPNVLLVNLGAESRQMPTRDLVTAIGLLDELGARVVVLLDLDHETALALTERALPHPRVVIGRKLRRNLVDSSMTGGASEIVRWRAAEPSAWGDVLEKRPSEST